MTAPTIAPARLYGREDGSGAGAGIEACGLSVRIEVGTWDMVVSASPMADDRWRGVPLDQRLPELMRVLLVIMQLRAGDQRRPELVRAYSLMMQLQRGGEAPPHTGDHTQNHTHNDLTRNHTETAS